MTVAFTGHRPNKLGGYGDTVTAGKLRATLLHVLNRLDRHTDPSEPFHFITGGALGFDTIAFDSVREFRATTERVVTLELAIPFEQQSCKWSAESVAVWETHRESADLVTKVDLLAGYYVPHAELGAYHPQKMSNRNRYMIANCSLLISCWDGSKGGTGNCVSDALKLGRIKIVNINPLTQQLTIHRPN